MWRPVCLSDGRRRVEGGRISQDYPRSCQVVLEATIISLVGLGTGTSRRCSVYGVISRYPGRYLLLVSIHPDLDTFDYMMCSSFQGLARISQPSIKVPSRRWAVLSWPEARLELPRYDSAELVLRLCVTDHIGASASYRSTMFKRQLCLFELGHSWQQPPSPERVTQPQQRFTGPPESIHLTTWSHEVKSCCGTSS